MNLHSIAEAIPHNQDDLESKLQRRVGSRVRHLRVLVRPNGIILKGWTPTYYLKQVAQHAVMELCELPILANDIEVK